MVTTRYSVTPAGATSERPGSTISSMSGAEVVMSRGDEPVQVVVDIRRHVAGLVPHAEAAAEVIDLEFAQRGERRDLRLELVELEDLRSDVRVQTAHVDHRRGPHPGDGLRHLLHRHAELG